MRNSTIDIFKAVACIGIVFIHIVFPGEIGSAVRALGRFGVPFFFCVSGYFLSSGDYLEPSNICRKLKHIVLLIVGSEIGYIVFTICLEALFDPAYREAFFNRYFIDGWIERLLLTNAPPVYAHLWFLYALAMIYLLILLFVKRKKTLEYFCIAVPILVLGIIFLQEFSFLEYINGRISFAGSSAEIYWAHTILFRAIPFFLVGIWFSENAKVVKKVPCKLPVLLGGIILCEVVAAFESVFFNVAQFYVGNILATFLIMAVCVKYPNLHCDFLEYIGRYLFTWIYICHIAISKILDFILKALNLRAVLIVQWVRPIVGLVLSIIVAFIIERCDHLVKSKLNERNNLKESHK